MKRAPTKKNMRKPKTKALKKTVVKTGTGTGKKQKVFVYGRVSSKKQIDGTGFPRQKQAALQRAKLVVGKGKFPTCNEVVSGTKPLDQRKVLGTLMSQKNIKIFVENARAIARTAKVGEDIYETAKERGIEIIADDIPNLFALKPRPVETFVRLVTLAVYQLERDLIVERLTKGLALAKKRSKRTTQFGEAKVNGTKSHLERKAPTKKQMKQLRQVIKKQKRGKISWRQTQADFRSVLRKPKLGIDTVRRMIGELELKHFWKGQRSWCMLLMSCFSPLVCCMLLMPAQSEEKTERPKHRWVPVKQRFCCLGAVSENIRKRFTFFSGPNQQMQFFPSFWCVPKLVVSGSGFLSGTVSGTLFDHLFWNLNFVVVEWPMTTDHTTWTTDRTTEWAMFEWPNPAGTSACSCSRQWRGRPARQCPEHQRPKTKDHSSISPVEIFSQDQTLYILLTFVGTSSQKW